jgi:integrase
MRGQVEMPKRLPKGCVEDVDRHGNVRIYFRSKGRPKVRLQGVPWTPEFMTAYRAAAAGISTQAAGEESRPVSRAPAGADTWRWLCERYFAAPEFTTQLDARTRKVRRSILEATFDEPIAPASPLKFADLPLPRFSPKAVRALRDRRADKREAANARLKAMRQAFAYGVSAALTETNPARDVPYLQGRTDGFHTWSLDEVAQFIARHPPGTKGYLALALLLFTGCRRSDVVALGRQHVRAGWLRYTQHKNRNRAPVTLDLPVLPVLQAAIDTMPARPAGHETELAFLITQFGRPFTANGFGNWFRKRCEEAGLTDCTAHGLRKAGATIAAENGATESQLMAIYGWRNPKQAALYTRKARQKILAGGAMHLIRLDPIGIVACPTSTGIPSGGTNSACK